MSVLIAVLLVAIAAYFVFGKKSKPAVPARQTDYKALLQAHVVYYQKLNDQDKASFEQAISDFLGDTRIEGVGTEVNDLDKVLISSSAVIPIFGFPGWRYQNLTNIILYPDTFDKEFQFEGENRNILGMVGSGYLNGQMLLSRTALTKGFSKNAGGENAASHEFVHLLDKSDGATDGVPENLMAHEYAAPWLHLMHVEMHKIETGHSDINPYALTNEAEFFAVATEYFFEKPGQLEAKHPELYRQLSLSFRQDLTHQ